MMAAPYLSANCIARAVFPAAVGPARIITVGELINAGIE
jgi:hypothetical protein